MDVIHTNFQQRAYAVISQMPPEKLEKAPALAVTILSGHLVRGWLITHLLRVLPP